MSVDVNTKDVDAEQGGFGPVSWGVRLWLGVLLAVGLTTVYLTNQWLTERFTETTLQRAQLRLALYSGNLTSELQRASIVPQFLARDPALIGALNSNDYLTTSQRLLSFAEETNLRGIMLLDDGGRVVAASERGRLGEVLRNDAYFVAALRSSDTIFTTFSRDGQPLDFTYSRRIAIGPDTLGVIVVEVDLRKFERSWSGIADAVLVTNSEGQIILATESSWRGLTEEQALQRRSVPSAIERALRATADWTALPADAYVQGRAVLRQELRVPFQGWRMVSFTTYASVRERVNTVLALEIMGFAILFALSFYGLNRRTASRLRLFQRDAAELRQLNTRLQREIAERQKVEKTLEVAEQTLAQSSKLAALGEMSAAVSHELNQPLAAMKTYLAGARLLLQRNRSEEALSSFQRIDDLITRMGAITKQLKSYARKGDDAFEPLEIKGAVNSALEMMEPQLRRRNVRITKAVPSHSVRILGDRLRLEQVIINLLRNALDATQGVDAPTIEVLVSVGEDVILTVRDNGGGIEDLDALFEPFYTTKAPGDGVGLGLAISSGIVNDLGGRLTARNTEDGGAVFEVRLPIYSEDSRDMQAGTPTEAAE
ncbi:sensor histidine kinase [Shimia ponticola]|uniref:sensor histidine kinase n=1 Tax=Shimia ponticola TaxID=2582893 RepID=UPI0011BD5779|nr:ATP-binding protein [Shimia ponticola]